MRSSKVIMFLLLFCFIFGPRFKLLDILLITSVFLCISGLFIIILKRNIKKEIIIFSIIVFSSLFYTLIITSVYNFQDLTTIELIIKNLLYLYSAYFIVCIYKYIYKGNSDVNLNYHIFIIGVINAGFSILVFLSDGFREQMLQILNYTNEDRRIVGDRSFDMSMGGNAIGSIVFSIIFIQGLYLKKKKDSIIINVGLMLIFIATLFTARTGLMIIILSIIIYWVSFILSGKKLFSINVKKFIITILTLIIVVIFIFLFNSQASESTSQQLEQELIPWAFELYYSYMENGELNTNSTDIIFNRMYFLPETTKDLIFGTSNMGRSTNLSYIPSDVGYVRLIFAVGIIGLVLIILPYIYMFYIGITDRHKNISSRMLIITLLVVFISNFKELVFLPRGGASILFIFFIASFLINQDKVQKQSIIDKGSVV
ncbi:hypothetical protein M3E13_01680 [Oceanobacillus kimchii]|uniref:hypothetical protein n=2 Tax=Oceanobacillus kimchii TaxID=746691 RepID=UPI0021A841DF|nr:hypothetical protein [Oceanobacillus kimchii]MCT2134613.1 hypothetical protein [Oceanobacillus kimchii]